MTVLVSSDTGLITSGDHFECYADGNPAPEFEWTIKTNKANTSVYSHAFYVNLNILQSQYIITECKAKNSISEITTELTFNTTGRPRLYAMLIRLKVVQFWCLNQ